MPDLVTHSTVGWLAGRGLGSLPALCLVLVGAQLPDLLVRLPGEFVDHAQGRFLEPLHTPFGVALACLLVAQLFEERRRPLACGCLLLGAVTHLLLDAMQGTVRGSYHWLFPFSAWNGQLAWIEIEDAIPTVPLQIALVLAVEGWLARRRRRRAAAGER